MGSFWLRAQDGVVPHGGELESTEVIVYSCCLLHDIDQEAECSSQMWGRDVTSKVPLLESLFLQPGPKAITNTPQTASPMEVQVFKHEPVIR